MKPIPLPVTLLLWIPRALAMLLVLLLAMYTVDVFVDGKDYWDTGADFVLRLIPAFSALCVLLLGWRRDGLAALGFLALSIAYLFVFQGWRSLPESTVLFVPPAGISLAFFARMKLIQRWTDPSDEGSNDEGGSSDDGGLRDPQR